MPFVAIAIFFRRITAIKSLMKDPAVPKRKKILVIFGLFYVLLPFDLLPIILFPVSWMDDLVLWIFIVWNLREYLDKYWLGNKTVNLKKKYRGKDIIDDVKFNVEEDNKDE